MSYQRAISAGESRSRSPIAPHPRVNRTYPSPYPSSCSVALRPTFGTSQWQLSMTIFARFLECFHPGYQLAFFFAG